MTDPLAGLREQARELAARRADIAAQAGVLAGQADAQRLAATTSAALGDAEAFTAAQATATSLFRQRRSVLTGVGEVDGELAGLITGLAGDPCDIEPDVPLALLPVRLETRYSEDGTVLRVRIYPDDVHVDRLDRGVSDDERAAGIAYWQAIWDGSVTEDAAWQAFVASVKPSRAEWVAAAPSPDLTTRPAPPVAAPGPVLGNPPALQQPARSPARCRIGSSSSPSRAGSSAGQPARPCRPNWSSACHPRQTLTSSADSSSPAGRSRSALACSG